MCIWTLKADDVKRIQSEQRKMLRMMLQTRRRLVEGECSTQDSSDSEGENEDTVDEESYCEGDLMLEDWVTWIQRATRIAEAELEKAQIVDWVREQRKRYWDFAGRVARCADERWSHAVLHWVPQNGGRKVGAPRKRWKDDLAHFCSQVFEEPWDWFVLAQDEHTWNSLREKFINTNVI